MVFIENWDHTGPSRSSSGSGMECSSQWCSYPEQGEGKGASKNWSYWGLALGMPSQNSVLELGLRISGDSIIKIAWNLEEREGTHQRNSLEEIEIFPWVNSGEIDALIDLMGLDLGKKGKNGKRKVKMITLLRDQCLIHLGIWSQGWWSLMSKNLVSWSRRLGKSTSSNVERKKRKVTFKHFHFKANDASFSK